MDKNLQFLKITLNIIFGTLAKTFLMGLLQQTSEDEKMKT